MQTNPSAKSATAGHERQTKALGLFGPFGRKIQLESFKYFSDDLPAEILPLLGL